MATGRLSGTVLGRPVEIDARGRDVVVRLAGLRVAWALRKSLNHVAGLVRWSGDSGLVLRAALGPRLVFQLAPRPGLIVRLLAPALRRR